MDTVIDFVTSLANAKATPVFGRDAGKKSASDDRSRLRIDRIDVLAHMIKHDTSITVDIRQVARKTVVEMSAFFVNLSNYLQQMISPKYQVTVDNIMGLIANENAERQPFHCDFDHSMIKDMHPDNVPRIVLICLNEPFDFDVALDVKGGVHPVRVNVPVQHAIVAMGDVLHRGTEQPLGAIPKIRLHVDMLPSTPARKSTSYVDANCGRLRKTRKTGVLDVAALDYANKQYIAPKAPFNVPPQAASEYSSKAASRMRQRLNESSKGVRKSARVDSTMTGLAVKIRELAAVKAEEFLTPVCIEAPPRTCAPAR